MATRRGARWLVAVGLALLAAVSLAACTGGSGGSSGGGTGSAGASSAASSGTPGAHPSGSTPAAAGGRWYVSLGDSIAFGFQQRRFSRMVRAGDYRPAAFPGFTAAVARSLRVGGGPVRTVNYGCPGETTQTLVTGGCPFRFIGARLHDPYPGAQLTAAERFLGRHRGAVALVTLAIGSNDLSGLRGRCALAVGCFRRGLGSVSLRTATRLARVTRALVLAARPARVVVLLPYDPLAVDAPATVPLLASYNRRLAMAARGAGATVVDPLPDFNAGGGAGRICRLTLYCGRDRDTHPSDAGYAELARLLVAAVRSAR